MSDPAPIRVSACAELVFSSALATAAVECAYKQLCKGNSQAMCPTLMITFYDVFSACIFNALCNGDSVVERKMRIETPTDVCIQMI